MGALKKRRHFSYFLQDGATADVLNEVIEDILVSCTLWPSKSPDLHLP
jgi:hypothetical protein